MKKSPLYESHKQKGARFISFAGWQMPFSYHSPAEEHHQVRQKAGLFDVSHMGQIRLKGKDSLSFLERLFPSDLKSLSPGKALYTVLCRESGGLIDDLIVYSFSDQDYLLCVNAGFKDKDLKWILSQKKNYQVSISDESSHWALIAVQGPESFELCQRVFPSVSFHKIPRFHFKEQDSCLLARTGYTGEEGFEIYVPWDQGLSYWNRFLKEGEPLSVGPVGFGARDTLRLEMAYLLSGQDFDESKSPLQAGLSWLVKSEADYIGKSALLKRRHYPKLKAFVVEGESGIPRKDFYLYSSSGAPVGQVTSGARSPSLQKMIGLAYIDYEEGAPYFLDIRGSRFPVRFVSSPFLKKERGN